MLFLKNTLEARNQSWKQACFLFQTLLGDSLQMDVASFQDAVWAAIKEKYKAEVSVPALFSSIAVPSSRNDSTQGNSFLRSSEGLPLIHQVVVTGVALRRAHMRGRDCIFLICAPAQFCQISVFKRSTKSPWHVFP